MIFGDLANIGEMMKKMKDMQGNLKRVQEELRSERYEGVAEGVRCTVSGDMDVKEVTIDPALMKSCDAKKLGSLVSEAVSSAISEAKDMAKDKLKNVTGGLSIPGLF